jgi:hypothetical protein
MRLPVSRLNVRFRSPDGNDDLALLEHRGSATEQALAAIARLGQIEAGPAEGWTAMTITDFETALLELRRFLLGDLLACHFKCSAPGCGERMEIEFSIREFLSGVEEEIAAELPPSVTPVAERQGWYRLHGKDGENCAEFRLVTVSDRLQIESELDGMRALKDRCVKLFRDGKRVAASVERAFESMAPLVSRAIAGTCAACKTPVHLQLNVPQLVLEELRAGAAGVHREVHQIAEAYHWSEATILAMPQARRQAYAELIEEVAI